MKTSLDALPAEKRQQIEQITELLREQAPVDIVILCPHSHVLGASG